MFTHRLAQIKQIKLTHSIFVPSLSLNVTQGIDLYGHNVMIQVDFFSSDSNRNADIVFCVSESLLPEDNSY